MALLVNDFALNHAHFSRRDSLLRQLFLGQQPYSASPAAPKTNSTAYELISSKPWSPAPSLAANDLKFGIAVASTGSIEVQARFAAAPIALNSTNDFLELTVVFTNTSGLFKEAGHVGFGLYYSGGVPPLAGGLNGIAATTTTTNGSAQNWQGYVSRIAFSGGTNHIATRPAQLIITGNNQDLITEGSSLQSYTNPINLATVVSTFTHAAAQFTETFRVTLTAANTLQLDSKLYLGGDTTGTLLLTNSGVTTSTNFLTNRFDSLAVGYRIDTNVTTSLFDIKAIVVKDGGPDFDNRVSSTHDSGIGSLRNVMADATNGATITFAPNLSGSTIFLTNGPLQPTTSLNLDASALPGGITLNGNGTNRVFVILSTTNVLTCLTLTNGNDSVAGAGGGIFNYFGNLTLNRCTIAGNRASNVAVPTDDGGGGGTQLWHVDVDSMYLDAKHGSTGRSHRQQPREAV